MYNEQISTIATVIIFANMVGDRVFTRKEFESRQAEIKPLMPAGLYPCTFDTMSGYFNIHHTEDFEVITVSGGRYSYDKVNITRAEYDAIPLKVRDLLSVDVQNRQRYHYQFSQSKIAQTKEELRKLVG